MAVQALYALQNGFMGFEKSGLFFGERSGERVRIPIAGGIDSLNLAVATAIALYELSEL